MNRNVKPDINKLITNKRSQFLENIDYKWDIKIARKDNVI